MTRYCRPQRTRPGPGETLTPTTIGENSGDKYANHRELQLTLFYLLCLSVGFVCTPEPLVYCRLLASAQRPAVRLPHKCCRENKKLSCCREIRGRCVYLAAVPAAVHGGKSAAPHWRDAICYRLLSCAAALRRARRPPAFQK